MTGFIDALPEQRQQAALAMIPGARQGAELSP